MNNPTDTNQASELFELCEKVYELTGWKPSKQYESWYRKGHYFSDGVEMQPDEPMLIEYVGEHPEFPYEYLAPLYTSDYLLEKLPNKIKGKHSTGWLTLSPMDKETWGAGYEADHTEHIDDYKFEWSDTPLLALLKLTIALSEAGELK